MRVADRWYQGVSLVVFVALSIVQIVGADALFGSLIARGLLPRSLTLAGITAPLLNLLHLAIYGVVAASFAAVIVGGMRAWRAGLVIAVPSILQVVTNGCILTPVQNAVWAQQGIPPIDNSFLFAAFVPLPVEITKALVFAVALFYLYPAFRIAAQAREAATQRA